MSTATATKNTTTTTNNKVQKDRKPTTTGAATTAAPKKDVKSPKDNTTTTNNNNNYKKDGDNKPTDPKLIAFENRINELFEQQNALKKKREELISSLQTKRTQLKDLRTSSGDRSAELGGLFEKSKALIEEKKKTNATKIKLIEEQKSRRDAIESQAKELPFRITSKTTLEEATLSIEKAAVEIEKEIEAERNVNLQRSLIKKQSGINAQKKSINEFFASRESLSQYDTAINAQKSKVEQLDKEINEVNAKIDTIKKSNVPSNEKINAIKEEITTMDNKVKELQTQAEAIKPKIDAEKQARTAYREESKKVREELKKKRQAEKEERDRKYHEEKEKREEEKRQEELRKVPYEEEMSKCDNLATYLEGLKPKVVAEKVVSTQTVNTADLDGMVALAPKAEKSRGGAKGDKKKKVETPKPLPEVIRHPMTVFSDFELISMAPPSKYADIDESITQLRAKKDHYKQLSAQVMEQRVLKAKQDAEKAATTTTTDIPTAEPVENDSSETTPATATPDTNGQVEVEAQ